MPIFAGLSRGRSRRESLFVIFSSTLSVREKVKICRGIGNSVVTNDVAISFTLVFTNRYFWDLISNSTWISMSSSPRMEFRWTVSPAMAKGPCRLTNCTRSTAAKLPVIRDPLAYTLNQLPNERDRPRPANAAHPTPSIHPRQQTRVNIFSFSFFQYSTKNLDKFMGVFERLTLEREACFFFAYSGNLS